MIPASPQRIAEYTGRGWWGTRRIQDWFDDAVRAHPRELALVDAPNRAEFVDGAPRQLTWGELDAEVLRFSSLLLDSGLGKDDVLCVQLPNCVELAALYVACAKLERLCVLEELPRNPVGKVLKRELRDRIAAAVTGPQ